MQNVLTWGFPVYLIVIEMIFRAALNQETTGFIGPAIAIAGLTCLIPLTKLMEPTVTLSPGTRRALKRRGLIPVNVADSRLVRIVWGLLLLGFLVWFWSCASSIREPQATWWFVPKHIGIGCVNYFVAMVCTIVKHYL